MSIHSGSAPVLGLLVTSWSFLSLLSLPYRITRSLLLPGALACFMSGNFPPSFSHSSSSSRSTFWNMVAYVRCIHNSMLDLICIPENWRPILNEEIVEIGNSVVLPDSLSPGTVASAWSPSDGRRPDIRFCNCCQNTKPPRCHHCSICQRCVLKMDHHCVWVVNCVGARNYKFFVLFLFYTFLETILDAFALLPRFIKFTGEARHSGSPGNPAIVFLVFVLNLAFALSLLCFSVMHISLLLSNTTTIEVYERKKVERWKYDMGKTDNFERVPRVSALILISFLFYLIYYNNH